MPLIEYNDEYFMRQALNEAQLAFDEGEVPVGCVIVCDNTVISRGHNMTEMLKDSTSHAEIIAITSAEEYLQSKYLKDCTLYVTVEPCVMCAGAIYWAQIPRIVFGAKDEKRGASLYGHLYHPAAKVTSGIMQEECSKMMKDFFKNKR
ncbi:MAG: tRNA adenosine(34) deaminase TadA [Bacteroidales bacterium]|nr:tRNA adenosine(34) deaminase TadA [Candidatus Scybalousia scybalohippi]MCQ2327457.1 tRNA adenosine(34) deaminase TadA [Bacteroidales bacterium]